jgi:hypothetical protein
VGRLKANHQSNNRKWKREATITDKGLRYLWSILVTFCKWSPKFISF